MSPSPVPGFLAWLGVCVVISSAHAGFVEDVTISAQTPGTYNGTLAMYKDEAANFTVEIHLNETWRVLNQAAHLVLKVIVPNNADLGATTCLGTIINDPPSGCLGSAPNVHSKYFDIKVENVRTELSEGVEVNPGFPVLSVLDAGTLQVDFGSVSLLPETTTAGGAAHNYSAPNITVLVDSVTYTEQESVRTFYTFSAEVQWRTLLPVSGGVLNDTVDLRLQGPDLLSTFSPLYPGGESKAQAGDAVKYTMDVSHSGFSTETAANVQVFMTFNLDQSQVEEGSVRFGSPGSLVDGNQTVLEDGLITVNLDRSSVLRVEYTLKITDGVRLQRSFYTQLRLEYVLQTDSSRRFEQRHSGRTVAMDVTFEDEPEETLPDDMAVGDTHDILKTFRMPHGSVVCDLFAEIETSGTLGENPLSFTDFKLESNSSGVVITGQNRRKRSPVLSRSKRTTHFVVLNVGTVTNPSATGTPNALITITGTAVVALVPQGGPITVSIAFAINGQQIPLSTTSGLVLRPFLTLNHTVEYEDTDALPTKLRFNATASHDALSNGAAALVELKGGSALKEIFWWEDGHVGPVPTDPELSVTSENLWTWSKAQLLVADSMLMSYESVPTESLPGGTTNFTTTVQWKPSSSSSLTFIQTALVCLERFDVETSSVVTEWGFIVLAVVCGLLLGFLVALLVVFLLIRCRCCRRLALSSVRPASAVDLKQIHEASAGHGLLLSAPKKKGFNTIKDLSGIGEDESIVGILAKKDRLQVYRDLDTWDIVQTIGVDTRIEDERNEAMMSATLLLMRNLQGNGDVDKSVVDKATQKFKKSVNDLSRKLDDDYKREIDEIYKRLSAKNQEKLADLLAAQQEEEEEMRERIKDLSPKEQEHLLELLKEQQETERSELAYRLKLEQDEESEKLRKEYAIKKRMGIKDAQQTLLEEVKMAGKLTGEQAEWLMKEYFKNQAAIEKLYDDEISRQRMALEEKLARRRALASQHEQHDEFLADEFNAIAGQQMSAISRMRKDGVLSDEDAREMREKAEAELLAHKSKMDADRAKQEQELHRKLSEKKRKRRADAAKNHVKELKELEKKHKEMQTKDGYCDPIAALEEKQTLLSQHRAEMNEIENELDKEHSEELMQLRNTIADNTRQILINGKTQTLDQLKEKGATDDQIARLLKKHEYELENLKANQAYERERQEEHFRKLLAKRRQQFAIRREEEKREQEMLREHEETVVRKLMDNQVAMSEDERERIMAEHEKQMVKLENSLTLNKLQQKRMLEEKLAQKRRRQMEKLLKKQSLEVKKAMRKADRDSDMDEDDKYQTEMGLLTKHAEQRIAVMQGEDIHIDDEMEEIRVEMMKQRASSLKEQEVKLGVMLAQLQMEKAKEMARIEEQQKAIFSLKTNLMDDLNEKGLLSDPECQRVLEQHQRDQAVLSEKLDSQRAKQERRLQEVLHQRLQERERSFAQKQEQEFAQAEEQDREEEALRARLESRLSQKEDEMAALHDAQLRRAASRADTPAAKIRRVALKHKQMLEMEKFRNRMEKEIEQTLQEMRRQSEIKRLQMVQEQELQFLNGLVRLGKFNLDELENVVHMLFPHKSEEETRKILDLLCEGYEAKPSSQPDEIDLNSSLVLRIRSASIRRGSKLLSAEQVEARHGPPRRRARGRTGSRRYDDELEFGLRPDPVGRSYSPDYGDQPSRRPPNRLAPLKKKKKPKKAATYDSDDELYKR